MRISIGELEELALNAKQSMLELAAENESSIMLNISLRANDPHIIIDEDGGIQATTDDLSEAGLNVRIAVAMNEEYDEAQCDLLTSVVAILVNTLDIEFDEDHIQFSDELHAREILEQVEWKLDNGIDY